MGQCTIPLTHLEEEVETLRWFPLEGGEGEISVGVTASGCVSVLVTRVLFVDTFFFSFDSRKLGESFSEDHPHWKESSMERHEV